MGWFSGDSEQAQARDEVILSILTPPFSIPSHLQLLSSTAMSSTPLKLVTSCSPVLLPSRYIFHSSYVSSFPLHYYPGRKGVRGSSSQKWKTRQSRHGQRARVCSSHPLRSFTQAVSYIALDSSVPSSIARWKPKA